ncbi:MAG: stage III sporulation protein AG [Lachnospiraceae bacterium]|nr:stage III sporulation protein AG [Lachnospiraceae bacterium]
MKQWLARLKNEKKDQIVILLLFGILLVVIAWPSGSESADGSGEQTTAGEESGNTADESDGADNADEAAKLEARLEEILSQVEGVGEVQTMITLKSDGRKVVEKDTEQTQSKEESVQSEESSLAEQSSASESTIYEKDSSGNETPYVTEELSPEILGVLVIAQGADSASVTAEITEAVMALFGIEAHKIKVMKME